MPQCYSRFNKVVSNVKGSRILTGVSSKMNLRLLVLMDKRTIHGTRTDIVLYTRCQRVWAVTEKRYAPSVMGKVKYIIRISKATGSALDV